jgi:uncharacterized protein YndB with AHSA1/START domain
MNSSGTPSLRVSRHLSAPPARAFDAWLAPALTSRWLFATPDGQIVRCDIDPRPGGAFVITDRRGGDEVEHVGSYVEVDRPRRLVFTFGVPKYSSDMTKVVLTFAEDADGCDLLLEHHDVPQEWRDQTEQGWRDLLVRLEQVLTD